MLLFENHKMKFFLHLPIFMKLSLNESSYLSVKPRLLDRVGFQNVLKISCLCNCRINNICKHYFKSSCF